MVCDVLARDEDAILRTSPPRTPLGPDRTVMAQVMSGRAGDGNYLEQQDARPTRKRAGPKKPYKIRRDGLTPEL